MKHSVAEIVLDVAAGRQRDAERVAYALGAQGIELRDGERGRVRVVLWLPTTTTKCTIEAAVAGIPDARVHLRRIEASWWQPRAAIPAASTDACGSGRCAVAAVMFGRTPRRWSRKLRGQRQRIGLIVSAIPRRSA